MIKGIHWVVHTRISQLAHQFTRMVLILIRLVASDQYVGYGSIVGHVEWHVVRAIAEDALVGALIGSDISKLHLLGHLYFLRLDRGLRGRR